MFIKLKRRFHHLLKFSIIGLGLGLTLDAVMKAGSEGIKLTIVSIFSVLILGFVIGKIFKVEKNLSFLISVGTAICGGSAIAAVTPIVKPDAKQMSVALAVIFALNSLALFIYPAVGHSLHLSEQDFGLWCAVGIHETSSVVGASGVFGEEAQRIATTVKLARALWIIPVSVMTLFLFKGEKVQGGKTKISIPWFIGGFILSILINTYLPNYLSQNLNSLYVVVKDIVIHLSKLGLNLTLFLIGTALSIESIGIKPLLQAVLLWVIISIGSLFCIVNHLL